MDPANPVLSELWRGDGVESMHRGAWVLVDTEGQVLDSSGDPSQLVYARSSTKSIQALPFVETADHSAPLTDEEVAVAIASHNGQDIHEAAVASILERAGLDADALQCGPQLPAAAPGAQARRVTNNCSGKHAGFLAAAMTLGDDPDRYLTPESHIQRAVGEAMLDMTRARPGDVSTAVDGCSAPTYRLPLRSLATGLARMANPTGLPAHRAQACRRITDAAASRPDLVGGTSTPRFDTELMRASSGRLFTKGGAEGVQTVGVVGDGVGFAAKIDDGRTRSLHMVTLAVLAKHGLLSTAEAGAMERWSDPVLRNRDDLEVGRHVVTAAGLGSPLPN